MGTCVGMRAPGLRPPVMSRGVRGLVESPYRVGTHPGTMGKSEKEWGPQVISVGKTIITHI